MDDIIMAFVAGLVVPALAIIVKKFVVGKVFDGAYKEVKVKTQTGKELNYFIDANVTDKEVLELANSELDFEIEVKKSILNAIEKNHDNKVLNFTDGNYIDFILELNGRKIGVEAKSSLKNFKANWVEKYISENEGVHEIIFIVNSDISLIVKEEIKSVVGNNRVDFISSKVGQHLNDTFERIINGEFSKNSK